MAFVPSCTVLLVATSALLSYLPMARASATHVLAETTLFPADSFVGGIWAQTVTFFLEAEGWMVPGLPVRASFLDLILALDTCASYRRHMKDRKHPWLQASLRERLEFLLPAGTQNLSCCRSSFHA